MDYNSLLIATSRTIDELPYRAENERVDDRGHCQGGIMRSTDISTDIN